MIARHRRRPGLAGTRRSRRGILAVIAVLVVVAIAIGEVAADVVNSGQPAALTQERSYVAAVVPVIDESTALSPWLRDVRERAPKLGREGLFAALSSLITGSSDVETQLSTVGIPSPSERAARILGRVFSERLRAARALSGAVTLALSSSNGSSALSGFELAASEIRRSDSDYTAFVRAVPRKARKHTVALPKSSWAGSLSWKPEALRSYLALLTNDSALRLRYHLTILAVTVEPPALRITPTTTTTSTTTTTTTSTTTTTTTIPGVTPSSTVPHPTTTTTSTTTTTTTLQIPPPNSTSWLAPTKTLTAVVVLANGGNGTEHHVVLRATLTALAALGNKTRHTSKENSQATAVALPSPESVRRRLGNLAAGSSRDIALPRFSVRDGVLYRLVITLAGAPGGHGSSDSESVRIQVAL